MIEELRAEYPRAEITPATDSFRRWVSEIVQRIEGKQPRLELPLDLQAPAFQRRVWRELQRHPHRRTPSSAQLPRSLCPAKALRAGSRRADTNPRCLWGPRRLLPHNDSPAA